MGRNITNNLNMYINKFQELAHQYLNEMKEHQNHQHSKEPRDCKNKKTMQDLFQQNYGKIEQNFQQLQIQPIGFNFCPCQINLINTIKVRRWHSKCQCRIPKSIKK